MKARRRTEISARAILERARRLLVDYGWTQMAGARDRSRRGVSPNDPAAVRFCMMGAMERSIYARNVSSEAEATAFDVLARAVNASLGVVSYNDAPGRRKRDVLAKFDRAIAMLDKEEVKRVR